MLLDVILDESCRSHAVRIELVPLWVHIACPQDMQEQASFIVVLMAQYFQRNVLVIWRGESTELVWGHVTREKMNKTGLTFVYAPGLLSSQPTMRSGTCRLGRRWRMGLARLLQACWVLVAA